MDQIRSRRNSTLVMGEVGCQLGQVALLVALLEGSVITVDMSRVVKNIQYTSAYGLQAIIEGSLGVSFPCTFQIYCGT